MTTRTNCVIHLLTMTVYSTTMWHGRFPIKMRMILPVATISDLRGLDWAIRHQPVVGFYRIFTYNGSHQIISAMFLKIGSRIRHYIRVPIKEGTLNRGKQRPFKSSHALPVGYRVASTGYTKTAGNDFLYMVFLFFETLTEVSRLASAVAWLFLSFVWNIERFF